MVKLIRKIGERVALYVDYAGSITKLFLKACIGALFSLFKRQRILSRAKITDRKPAHSFSGSLFTWVILFCRQPIRCKSSPARYISLNIVALSIVRELGLGNHQPDCGRQVRGGSNHRN